VLKLFCGWYLIPRFSGPLSYVCSVPIKNLIVTNYVLECWVMVPDPVGVVFDLRHRLHPVFPDLFVVKFVRFL
jgi:hypothetical protein